LQESRSFFNVKLLGRRGSGAFEWVSLKKGAP
jgi:hypothetical protein